jgi:hypothetical protein
MNTLLHAEFLAQVKPADFGVFGKFLWLARSENSPLGHDVGAVGNAERLSHIMISDQNSDTPIA